MRAQVHAFLGSAASAGLLLACAGCGPPSAKQSLERGLSALAGGDADEAAVLLEKAARRMPDSATARCNLGIAYWKLSNPERAIEAFRKAGEMAPDDPVPMEFLGRVFADLGRWEEARTALAGAYQRSSLSPDILNAMGTVEHHAGDTERAQTYFLRALELDAAYAPALYNMAVLSQTRLKNAEQAGDWFRKYLEAAGDDPHAEAARLFLDPPQPPPPSPAEPLLKSARQAIQKEAFDEALVLLNQSVSRDPGNADAVWELAALYDRYLQHPAKAAAHYRAFAERFAADPRAAAAASRANEMGKPAPAASQAPPAAGPAEARDMFRQGLERQQKGDLPGAMSCYRRALDLDGTFADAACNLGLACKAGGDLVSARDAFLRALRINPKLIEANYMLAVVYHELGDRSRASDYLSKTLSLDPDYAKAHLLLGLIRQGENRVTLARQHFRRFVELAPQDPDARKVKEWLRANP